MKKIGTILRFELGNYFGSKSYLISTILLALLCVGIMFAPRIKESFTSGSPSSDKETDAEDESDQENESVYPVLWMKDCWRRYIRMLSCRNVRMQQK